MNPFKLITLALTPLVTPLPDNSTRLDFSTDTPGSFQVLTSCDLKSWVVSYSGHVRAPSSVTARLRTKDCEFFIVNFIPDNY